MSLSRKSCRKPVALGVFAMLLIIQGCGEDWALGFSSNGGRTIPDARIEVALAEPMDSYELFSRLETLAIAAGFPARRSNNPGLVRDQLLEPKKHRSWVWHPSENSSTTSLNRDYQILAFWDETNTDPLGFGFIFYNKSTNEPTALEWLLFQRWIEFYFPTEFLGSRITVTGHFAEFNSCEDAERVSKLTGISVPDKIAKNCDWWREEERDD